MTDIKYRKYGLCQSCLWDWMQNNESGMIYYEKVFAPKVKRKTIKAKKEKNRKIRESLKSIARLISEARVPFQKWIRLRDANESCISCGCINAKIWHSGHYLKAELYTGLIFDETNVNKQCERCNTFLSGNEIGYRKGLVKKYGENKVKELEGSANDLRQHKFSREEIKEIKSEYQKKLNNK